jgi:formate hydrogenlyase transcriptional activator
LLTIPGIHLTEAAGIGVAQRPKLESERDLELLLEVSRALTVHLDLRDLFTAISASIRRLIPHDYAALSLYDPELRQFRLHALDFPGGHGLIREEIIIAVQGSPHGKVFTTIQPLLVNRLSAEQFPADITNWLVSEGIQSACWLPMQRADRCIGVLNVASKHQDAFSQREMMLLDQIANQIAIAVENALAFQQINELKNQLAEEKDYLEDEIRTEYHYDEMIGESPAWKVVLEQIETVAPTDATVLIVGETGTGKELVARAIHDRSRRSERTLVKLSCAALPAGLLEAELFGHEKGAFTGAISRRLGRFELANKGTLFLDEIGEIPIELQSKILRALQENEFERLGSGETRKVDVRIIAATNRNLTEMVAKHEFRDDLYYRLNVFPITVPPLRERSTDVALFVRYFVQKIAGRMRKRIDDISAETMRELTKWHWPGNVRELQNFIERSVILTRGPRLQVPLAELSVPNLQTQSGTTLESVEREHILQVLRECKGVVGGPGGAAVKLGMNRSTLNSRMRKLGISRDAIR